MVRANWMRAGRVGSIAASVLGGHRSPAPEAVVVATPRVHRVIAEVGAQLPPHHLQSRPRTCRPYLKEEAPLDRGGAPPRVTPPLRIKPPLSGGGLRGAA